MGCNTKITGVYLINKKDIIHNDDGSFRIKRKYGNHKRHIIKIK